MTSNLIKAKTGLATNWRPEISEKLKSYTGSRFKVSCLVAPGSPSRELFAIHRQLKANRKRSLKRSFLLGKSSFNIESSLVFSGPNEVTHKRKSLAISLATNRNPIQYLRIKNKVSRAADPSMIIARRYLDHNTYTQKLDSQGYQLKDSYEIFQTLHHRPFINFDDQTDESIRSRGLRRILYFDRNVCRQNGQSA